MSGGINLMPGSSAVKSIGATTRITPQIVKQAAIHEAKRGAALGVAEVTGRTLIDEGRLPTASEVVTAGGIGSVFGGSIGAGTPYAQRSLSKFLGKTAGEIDEAIARGDIGADDVINVMTEGRGGAAGMERVSAEIRRDVAASAEATRARNAAEAVGAGNKLREPSELKKVIATVAPSAALPKEAVRSINEYRDKVNAAESMASRIQRAINKHFGDDSAALAKVNAFLDGGDIDPSIEILRPDLEKYRQIQNDYQVMLLRQLDEGSVQGLDESAKKALMETISKSIRARDYTHREYLMFADATFEPDAG